jgi:hypothetical protein
VPAPEILTMAEALLEKMAAFILSDFPTPLQKHQESPRTPILGWLKTMGLAQNGGSSKRGIAASIRPQMGMLQRVKDREGERE